MSKLSVSHAVPKLISKLMPYQEEATRWCLDHEEKGGILAYDMGLGKTVIGCATIVKKTVQTLVLLPTSLLSQWESEIKKHTTGVSVAIYHGPQRSKTRSTVFRADVVLTTAIVAGKDMSIGIEFPMERWIIDEAHRLKNNYGKTYKNLSYNIGKVKYRLFFTGTPVCNHSKDLISLVYLTKLEPYNDPEFWKKKTHNFKIKNLKKILPKIILKRTKEDTIPDILPPITTKNIPLVLPKGIQTETYNYFLSDEIILRRILRMRQASNDHKQLGGIISHQDSEIEQDYLQSEMSVKLQALKKQLGEIPLEDKVLVFSQFTSLLHKLHDSLNNESNKSIIYHGGLSAAAKSLTIQQFKTVPSIRVLFINLRAGGCGLNLVEANHVIMLEPYWNESEQKQAIDRTYRIGQVKPVTIYKMYIRNSIETWLQQIQKMKKILFVNLFKSNITGTDAADEIAKNKAAARNLFKFMCYTRIDTEEFLNINSV
jgi:SNF2 family DNA or RNA helicase